VAIILNLDTAVQSASICLAEDGKMLGFLFNPSQKDQAGWLHTGIKDLLAAHGVSLQAISAVAISAGPGSYTGLRVGMSAAKGLCYSLKIPLITIGTLQMMAFAAQQEPADLFCPMIDARRNEVFTAVFDRSLSEVIPASNLILDENSFKDLLDLHRICFFGNGSTKFRSMMMHPNGFFSAVEATAEHMMILAHIKFIKADFADLAYSQPFYGKDFYSPVQ
jgi:tRNA threonylcarbamoyladenosine biosynthesis protein TsaB